MKQLLCYGDSNTWGLIPGTHDRYPWVTRWTGILQNNLNEYGIRVVEEGLCGRTTVSDDEYRENRNGLEALSLVLETHAPLDYAVIMLGTNDCKSFFNLNANQIAMGMERCIDKLLTVIPAENILLVSPITLGENVWKPGFDPEFGRESVEVSHRLKEEYGKLATRKKISFLAACDYAQPGDVDCEHLTIQGHSALAQAISDKLKNDIL